MTKLEILYNLANKHKIEIHYFDLKHLNTLGLNVEKEGLPYMIFLDNSLKHDNKLHLEVLAHEMGHYFSTVGNYIEDNKEYRNQLFLNKTENTADRWAYDYLVPERDLVKAINKKITDINDLADYFEISIEFFIKRLEYLSLRKPTLRLYNNTLLILTNLPNLYIYKEIGGHHED